MDKKSKQGGGSNRRSLSTEAGTVLLNSIKESKVLMRKGMISSNEVKLARKSFEEMKLGLGPKQARKPIIERRLKQVGKSRKTRGKEHRDFSILEKKRCKINQIFFLLNIQVSVQFC